MRCVPIIAVLFLTLVAAGLAAPYDSARPYVRWWWFAGEFDRADIDHQLHWLHDHGFGGVEIAWIYPRGRDPDAERIAWLGEEWTRVVAHTKRRCDALGLGCDFTFGTLWPFGGTFVSDADRTRVYDDPAFKQRLRLSWTHPEIGNVVDHLDADAFGRYADVMGAALAPALAGSTSALFCDSWEVQTRNIWTPGFGDAFEAEYGYDLRPFMDDILAPDRAAERYDYLKLVAEFVRREFYEPFTAVSHELGAISRVQCAGSPTDLLAAYAAVDVPETEAMLYEPGFARIPVSAAALAGKPVVSAEAFTCLYGFPAAHLGDERIGDLRLVADALFAHGVNQIVWHGMPYNGIDEGGNRFYATVHVGEEGTLAGELAAFNAYLTRVSSALRRGRPYTDVAVYLPLEDAWIAGEYPPELQQKWSWGQYELRYVRPARELAGHHPLWVSRAFLADARFADGVLQCGLATFTSLYVDVAFLEPQSLDAILRLARQGLPVCLKQRPRRAGRAGAATFPARLDSLQTLPNVAADFREVATRPPLLAGDDLPPYHARVDGDGLTLFVGHPAAARLTLPMAHGCAEDAAACERRLTLRHGGESRELALHFPAGRSLLLRVDDDGVVVRPE